MNNKIIRLVVAVIFIAALVGAWYWVSTVPEFMGYTENINKVLLAIIVLAGVYFVSQIFGLYISKIMRVRNKDKKTPDVFNKLLTAILLIVTLVLILHYNGVEITPVLAALGIGALAIGLALQPTLSNLFSGILVLTEKQIKIGDHIQLGETDISGYVEDISWRATTIRTLPNNRVVIPNSKIIDSVIIDHWTPDKEMAALVQVGVDYGSDLKHVEKVTVEVARQVQKTVPGAVPDFEPFIRYHTFGDNNIGFTVILRVKEFVDKYLVTHEFIKALKEKYDKEGIEISWPIRKIYEMK